MSASSFSCWLIGADSLLEECGDILLRGGHEVRGVVSASSRIKDWARVRGLAALDPKGDFEAELALRPFDHLFAITHLELLPEQVLRLPVRSAINFHDGPLPEYAGLNAPAWALINGEARHGITWHVMTPALDGGPILKQRFFDLGPEETSFSLNARCFEAAIDSFAELVADLEAGTVRPLPQDTSRRSLYERHRRPPAACAIDWTRSAREIDALVRALDFGRYPNPLGLAKIQRAQRTLLVTRASPHAPDSGAGLSEPARAPARSNGHSVSTPAVSAPAGTVLASDERQVLVATASGTISLRGFADLSGRQLDPEQAARRLDLFPGVMLDLLAPEHTNRLTELDGRMSRAERFWVQRLAEINPITLSTPGAVRGAAAADSAPADIAPGRLARPTALSIVVPPEFAQRFPEHPPSLLLLAAYCAYLARLTRRATFDLGYGDAALREEAEGRPWIAARIPLRIGVDLDEGLDPLIRRISAELADVRGHGPWLWDVAARYPELRALRGRTEPLLPVAVDICTEFAEPALTDGAQWALEVRDAGTTTPCACRLLFDAENVSAEYAASLQAGFAALLASLAAHPTLALSTHPVISAHEVRRQRVHWNRTAQACRREACVHELFEEQVLKTPGAAALVCGEDVLTYAELNARADGLARELSRCGVWPGMLVGIFVERSVDLVAAVLGALKAGCAYVPLDPAHPAERLAFIAEDAQIGVIVTQQRLVSALPACDAQIVCVDADPGERKEGTSLRNAPAGAASPADLAYVIYTSGSTGRPKGVLVEHRNVASFFAAMDVCIPHDPPGVWLALASLSFDISVLELLWPLCRGFKVVVHAGDEHARELRLPGPRPAELSLFFFSSDEGERSEGYRLLLEGARFADAHGFCAVWTPERHFHAFGGLYPNPAVTGAALAAITHRIQIRAGSVVLPLHHPIRVAEDWAVVDNLSGGRVGISFASGWNPDDFVLAPGNHAHAKDVMFRDIEVVQRLWRGETLSFPGPDGAPVDVRTLPRPVQPELPIWITSAGNVETYAAAGRIGANVLTHLLGQSLAELAPKISAYRDARAQAGFDPAAGVVALMLHTFVGADEERVRELVREPLERYLASSLDLLKQNAWAFPAFRRPGGAQSNRGNDLAALDSDERAALLTHARERYYETSGLFGTPERCLEQVERVRAVDVDEIACLIDFGLPTVEVLASLPFLDRVRAMAQALRPTAAPTGPTLAAQILREEVTHLQCTPSRARILCADPEAREALRRVHHVFIGGEALPADLAAELAATVGGSLTNMYGPTETTVWSSTHVVVAGSPCSNGSNGAHGAHGANGAHGAKGFDALTRTTGTVPIGRPIANTRFHVLDEHLQPLPIGTAGELFIAGYGVARGYLRRPELDAERFLPESPAKEGSSAAARDAGDARDPDARMYRTGDLVRYRADGVLEFLGRVDDQIKIRGHRVEPGEIEAVLLRADVSGGTVSEAVVVVREDTPGDQRLIAYLVPLGPAPDPVLLRERLQARLPEVMVPAGIVFLERLPRNTNGKIDRRALPAPEARPLADCVRPIGELESRLAELWREVLGHERVGVEDNFFDLGGHSLLIVQLHRRMREISKKRVSLTDLFRFPTIRSLVRHLASANEPDTVEEASRRGRRRRKSTPTGRQRTVEGGPEGRS
jgi:natural product biosynthesis luciferase-like monooxygenase protein